MNTQRIMRDKGFTKSNFPETYEGFAIFRSSFREYEGGLSFLFFVVFAEFVEFFGQL